MLVPRQLKQWRGSSLALGSAITGDALNRLLVVVHLTAAIVIPGCTFAIGFAPSVPVWWRPLAILGAGLGLVAFAVFWDGQVPLLVQEGAIGAVVSLIPACDRDRVFGSVRVITPPREEERMASGQRLRLADRLAWGPQSSLPSPRWQAWSCRASIATVTRLSG